MRHISWSLVGVLMGGLLVGCGVQTGVGTARPPAASTAPGRAAPSPAPRAKNSTVSGQAPGSASSSASSAAHVASSSSFLGTPSSSPSSSPAPASWVAVGRLVYPPSAGQTYASWWDEQFGSVNAQGILFVVSATVHDQPVLFSPPAPAPSPPQSVTALRTWFSWMSQHQAMVYYLSPAQAAQFPQKTAGSLVLSLSLTALQQQDRGAHWVHQHTTSFDDAFQNTDLPF